jgi:hypothetical protein
VVKKGEVIDSVEFLGTNSDVEIVTEQGFHYNYPIGGEKPLLEENIVMEAVKPTVPSGERVGHIEYKIGNKTVGTVRLIARRNGENKIAGSGMFKDKSRGSGYGLLGFLLVLPVSVLTFRFIVKSRKRRNIFRRK